MKTRKQLEIEKVNLMLESRYLNKKFIMEDDEDNGLPEFQVTPEGMGKSKIKFTWKSKGVDLPQDVRDSDLFSTEEGKEDSFEPLKKIYTDKEEAAKTVSDFINTKQYLFKKM